MRLASKIGRRWAAGFLGDEFPEKVEGGRFVPQSGG